MPARNLLRNHWPAITITVTAAAIACAAFVLLRNMPPHRIVMATGPEGSAYQGIGERYRAALARANVEVQLVPTAGSVETAAMLRDPHSEVSVGLIQGGVIGAANTSGLESLGTISYEPSWWFHRREIQGVGVDGLRGRKIAIGSEGSGNRATAPASAAARSPLVGGRLTWALVRASTSRRCTSVFDPERPVLIEGGDAYWRRHEFRIGTVRGGSDIAS
jgi:hypothetical protein